MVVRKVLKITKWVFLALLSLIIFVTGLVYFGAQPYLNKHLSGYVAKKTGGLYQFGFSKIELNAKQRGLLITGVDLSYNEQIAKGIQANKPDKVFYSFSSPELQINNIDIAAYLFNKDIRAKTLRVANPQLKMTGPDLFGNDSVRVFDYALKEIRPIFTRFIHSITVDEIEFIDANYQFFNFIGDSVKVSNAEKVSVGISGFRTDAVKLSDYNQPFTTVDVFIRIAGFKNQMSDSLHLLEIDSIEYSLKNREIKAFRSHLFPKIKTGDKSLYDVYVPKFRMRSNNLAGFHFADTLNISSLELEKPEITFTRKINPRRVSIEDINSFDLYDLVKNDFKEISVDSFYLGNARLTIFKNIQETGFQQKLDNIDIHLVKFRLDSVSGSDQNKLFYADEFEMKVRGYELNLEDNFHRMVADSIFVSTFTDSLEVSQIKISPLSGSKNSAPVILNIGCKKVSLKGIDLKQVYNQRIVPTSVVRIIRPSVSIEHFPELAKKNTQTGLFFDLVSAYLKGVYSNRVTVEKGTLSFRNYKQGQEADNFETDFSFALTGFSLDSASQKRTDKFFYATNFDLNFSDFKMHLADNLHKLDVNKIHVSSANTKVAIDSLHLYQAFPTVDEELLKKHNRSELYDVFVPSITLQNANLHQAFFQKILNIDSFRIENPRILYENFAALKNRQSRQEFSDFYDLLFNYVNDISIVNLTIPSGQVRWVNHSKKSKTISLDNHFSTELQNFRLNPEELGKQKLFFSEQLQLSLKDQLFSLSDSIHYLKAGQIDFSTSERKIVITDALLYPDTKAQGFKSKPTTIRVSIPRLTFNQIDIATAWFSKKIEVGEIRFDSPKLEVYSQKGREKTIGLKKFTIPLPLLVESLKIGKIHLPGGQVVTYQTDGTIQELNSSFNIDLESDNILISHSSGASPNNIESENIHARLSDFLLTFEDKTHEARFNELDFDKKNKTIGLKNFRIIPMKQKQPGNIFNLNSPKVTLTGFDIDKAYENSLYGFDLIKFDSPVIEILLTDSLNNNRLQKFSKIKLYDYLEPYLNELTVGELSFENTVLKLNAAKTKFNQDKINLQVKNIAVNKNTAKQGLLNSDGFEFETYDYSKILSDKNYIFRIDTISYSTLTNSAELKSVSFTPLKSAGQIAREKGFQVDIVDAKTSFVKLEGFDFENWLEKRTIKGSLLKIGPSSLKVFRDKNFPFNKDQRPKWPQQLLYKIDQPFEVDSVTLMPSSVIYSELLEHANNPVNIDFSELSARIGRVTNISGLSGQKNKLNIVANGKVLKVGQVNLSVDFDLTRSDYYHLVKGSLDPLKMNIFNDIVEKNTNLMVEDGQMNRFDFELMADSTSASGNLWFDYDQLKIAVLNYRKADTVKSVIGSFMANSFVVNSKNPHGKILEPEKIDYRHDPSRSILNYWWKSVFTSAKTILGIKSSKEKSNDH